MANSYFTLTDTDTQATKKIKLIDQGDGTFAVASAGLSGGSTVPTSVGEGRKTVATPGTPVALAASTPCQRVTIQALDTNGGQIAVGSSTVVAASGASRTGIILSAGDAYELGIDNLSKVFIDATVSGEGVTFVATA